MNFRNPVDEEINVAQSVDFFQKQQENYGGLNYSYLPEAFAVLITNSSVKIITRRGLDNAVILDSISQDIKEFVTSGFSSCIVLRATNENGEIFLAHCRNFGDLESFLASISQYDISASHIELFYDAANGRESIVTFKDKIISKLKCLDVNLIALDGKSQITTVNIYEFKQEENILSDDDINRA